MALTQPFLRLTRSLFRVKFNQASFSSETDISKFFKDHNEEVNSTTNETKRGLNISDDLLISTSVGWNLKGETHQELTAALQKAGILSHPNAIAAYSKVDRRHFCPSPTPYLNKPVSISDKATISTPQAHAQALDTIAEKISNQTERISILDIGCGSGFLTACFALMNPSSSSSVLGLDVIPELIENVIPKNFEEAGLKHLLNSQVRFVLGDACDDNTLTSIGKFDVINCGVSVQNESQCEQLLSILNNNGEMIAPIGYQGQEQQFVKFQKNHNGQVYEPRSLGPVMFAPLLPASEQNTKVKSAKELKEEIQNALEQWKLNFAQKNQRLPTKVDLLSDPEGSVLFMEFSRLNRRFWSKDSSS